MDRPVGAALSGGEKFLSGGPPAVEPKRQIPQ